MSSSTKITYYVAMAESPWFGAAYETYDEAKKAFDGIAWGAEKRWQLTRHVVETKVFVMEDTDD